MPAWPLGRFEVAFELAPPFRPTPFPVHHNRSHLGRNTNRRWTVLASRPVDSERRLAARPVGGAQLHLDPLGHEDLQQAVDQGGLADTGAAGNDGHLTAHHQSNSLSLRVRERSTGFALDPGGWLYRH